VRQGDEAKAAPAQFYKFLNNPVGGALAGPLPIGAPHRTKRTVFGASSHSLHRCPHIAVSRQQIPASRFKVLRLYFSAFINPFRHAGCAVTENAIPDRVAVALHNHMCAALLKRLLRIERGMDSPKHNPGSPIACCAAHFVSSKGVAGVNANAHDVASLNTLSIDLLQSFIAEFETHVRVSGRGGQHVQPSWGYDSSYEGGIAGINEMDIHSRLVKPLVYQSAWRSLALTKPCSFHRRFRFRRRSQASSISTGQCRAVGPKRRLRKSR